MRWSATLCLCLAVVLHLGGTASEAASPETDLLPPGTARALELVTGEHSVVAQAGTLCSGGIQYDDGTFEDGYGFQNSVFAGTYGMRFDLPGAKNRLTAICICWRTLGGSGHDYGLRIWAADGVSGGPGTLLQVLPAASATGINVAGTFVRYEIPGGLEVSTDSIYVAPTWAASLFPNRFLCADENGPGGQPAYSGTYSAVSNPEIRPTGQLGVPGIFPEYKALGIRVEAEAVAAPPPPSTGVITSSQYPNFRFWVRIGDSRAGTAVPGCLPETICVAGAIPTRAEVFVRIVGPKSNGYLWPNVVKFNTTKTEVWIQQISTGETKYYLLPALATDSDTLPGLVDRTGFLP